MPSNPNATAANVYLCVEEDLESLEINEIAMEAMTWTIDAEDGKWKEQFHPTIKQ